MHTPPGTSASPPALLRPGAGLNPARAAVLLERVAAIFARNLQDGPEGKAFLEKRGITDAGLWTRHRLGYSNGRLSELLPNEGPIWDELKMLGVLMPNGQERFTGCAVFPVTDADGQVVTLYGQPTGTGAERHLCLPDRPAGLWNVAALKTYAHLILVESILDALSVMMAGHQNVISLPDNRALKDADLAGSGVQRLTLVVGSSRSGCERRNPSPTLAGLPCKTIRLPDDHHPNSYLVACGALRLAELLANGQPPKSTGPNAGSGVLPLPGGFALTLGVRRYEIRGLEKGPRKLRATVRVEHAGKIHVDTLDFYSARWRRQLTQDLCRVLLEAPDTIEADLARLMAVCESQSDEPAALMPIAGSLESQTPEDRKAAEEFGRSPDLIARILADYEKCGLVGERANKLLAYLAMTSRKLEKPLSVLILSSSGAGKTMLQDTALQFCPPEDLVKLTSLSGKALFYKEQTSLKRKVLALEEGDGIAEAAYALRNLISAGQLTIEATIKDLATGKLTTMANRVDGPTAVFVTTGNPDTDAETRSRFWVTAVDESREQTQAILVNQRKRQTLAGLCELTERESLLRRHHNFQRRLQPLAIVNPYADQLTYGDTRLQSRREQPKYLLLIMAIALLRQLQKPVKSWGVNGAAREYIEVDKEDIRLANELTTELLGQTLDDLSRPGHDLLMQLERMTRPPDAPEKPSETMASGTIAPQSSGFTRRAVREATGWSQTRVHRYLTELLKLEYVVLESGRNGQLQTCRLLYDGQGQDGRKFVPGLRAAEELTG